MPLVLVCFVLACMSKGVMRALGRCLGNAVRHCAAWRILRWWQSRHSTRVGQQW